MISTPATKAQPNCRHYTTIDEALQGESWHTGKDAHLAHYYWNIWNNQLDCRLPNARDTILRACYLQDKHTINTGTVGAFKPDTPAYNTLRAECTDIDDKIVDFSKMYNGHLYQQGGNVYTFGAHNAYANGAVYTQNANKYTYGAANTHTVGGANAYTVGAATAYTTGGANTYTVGAAKTYTTAGAGATNTHVTGSMNMYITEPVNTYTNAAGAANTYISEPVNKYINAAGAANAYTTEPAKTYINDTAYTLHPSIANGTVSPYAGNLSTYTTGAAYNEATKTHTTGAGSLYTNGAANTYANGAASTYGGGFAAREGVATITVHPNAQTYTSNVTRTVTAPTPPSSTDNRIVRQMSNSAAVYQQPTASPQTQYAAVNMYGNTYTGDNVPGYAAGYTGATTTGYTGAATTAYTNGQNNLYGVEVTRAYVTPPPAASSNVMRQPSIPASYSQNTYGYTTNGNTVMGQQTQHRRTVSANPPVTRSGVYSAAGQPVAYVGGYAANTAVYAPNTNHFLQNGGAAQNTPSPFLRQDYGSKIYSSNTGGVGLADKFRVAGSMGSFKLGSGAFRSYENQKIPNDLKNMSDDDVWKLHEQLSQSKDLTVFERKYTTSDDASHLYVNVDPYQEGGPDQYPF